MSSKKQIEHCLINSQDQQEKYNAEIELFIENLSRISEKESKDVNELIIEIKE